MQRPALGLIAIVLLAIGVATHGGDYETVSGSSLRIGAVLAVFWLAYPQLQRVPRWLMATLGACMLAVMIRPKLIVVVLPLAGLLWLLRPRAPRPAARVGDPRD